MRRKRWFAAAGLLVAALVLVALTRQSGSAANAARGAQRAAARAIQHAVIPGPLSAPHALLADGCGACHTPGRGVQADSCIACHANNHALVERQPTAFHGTIGECNACHFEHQGALPRPIRMDHAALVSIGHKQSAASSETSLPNFLRTKNAAHAEAALNCSACHSMEDPHRQQFGTNCAACHTTDGWAVANYRHPSPNSRDCAQCHLAPPCHHTSHFRQVCAQAAGKPQAEVNACYLCHQNTAWNDIKGVGWYQTH